MRPEAVAAMLEVLDGTPGNPSGQHRWARDARRVLDDARDAIAGLLGVEPGAVVFTSGGTEADNLAVRGVTAATGGSALCSAIEHRAVLDVDAVAEVVAEARPSHPNGLFLHTDAVAAAAWVDVAEAVACADLITVSGHKVGGPKGIGVLAVRPGVPLAPILTGGGQERERRSGTPNVAGAVGLGVAMAVTARDRAATVHRVREQAERLVAGLTDAVDHVRCTVPARSGSHVANIVHLSCREVSSEALLFLLDEGGVAASAGSSCASGALEPSHVVEALGVTPDWGHGALRLSLGWSTTDAEIDHALAVIPAAIDQLRTATTAAAAAAAVSGSGREAAS